MLITNDYEAFVFIKNHLLTQNAKSIQDNGDCLYRGYSQVKIEELKDNAHLIAKENYDIEEVDSSYFNEFWNEIYRELVLQTVPDAMCAVGCIVLDDFYDDEMEGKTIEFEEYVWDSVVKSNPAWKMTESSYRLLQKLQSIHDTHEVDSWEVNLSLLNVNFDKYGDYTGR